MTVPDLYLAARSIAASDIVRDLGDVIPAGEPFVLVDDGFLDIAELVHTRQCRRFASSWAPRPEARIVQELRRWLNGGVSFVVFAWPAQWWLRHYSGLLPELDASLTLIYVADGCLVFGPRLARGRDKDAAPQVPDVAERIEALTKRIDEWRARAERSEWLVRVGEIVRATIPPGAVVLYVSAGDDALLRLGRTPGWHFPQTDDGTYAGRLADGYAVAEHLNDLCEKGAEYLFFPRWAVWWLDQYRELRQRLDTCRTIHDDKDCFIYALGPLK